MVRARNATGGFPRVATVESCRAIVRADPLHSPFPRIRYNEAQKLYPKKPAKKMGAKLKKINGKVNKLKGKAAKLAKKAKGAKKAAAKAKKALKVRDWAIII